jgi:hypothetical protein
MENLALLLWYAIGVYATARLAWALVPRITVGDLFIIIVSGIAGPLIFVFWLFLWPRRRPWFGWLARWFRFLDWRVL